MRPNIQTKLIIAFLAIIVTFLTVVGLVAMYNRHIVLNTTQRVKALWEKTKDISRLQIALSEILMPINDYIITGKRKYISDYKLCSKNLEKYLDALKDTTNITITADESEILKEVCSSWHHIKKISHKIFMIRNPVGNREAARLMEEMDYIWGFPIIRKLEKWHELSDQEYSEALNILKMRSRKAWNVMFLSTVILAACSITFTLIFSRRFVRIIDEGTKELQVMMEKFRESEEHFRLLTETASDAIIGMEAPGIVNFWNKKAEEMFGYPASEAMGKDMHSLIVPERYREKAIQGLRLFFQTGTGHIVGKTVGLFALRRGDAEFPVELSVSAMKMRGKWQAVGIIRDITERKKMEENLKQRLDDLEQFRKVTIKREIRMRELKDRMEELEREVKK